MNFVVKKAKISDLVPADYNPRVDLKPGDEEFEKLRRSIQEFGYVEPIVVNKRTGLIVGGHQRAKVLEDEGYDEIEYIEINVDPTAEKALNLALNKISGSWDMPKLKDLLIDLDTGEFDIELTGFDIEEIEDLMTQTYEDEKTADDVSDDEFDVDAALDEIDEPITKPGDIWQLGDHRLMCGDSTNIEHVKILMKGDMADLVFTDPPYGMEYQSNGRVKSKKFDVLQNDDKILDFLPCVQEVNTGFVFVCTTWKVLDKWIPLFTKYFELTNFVIWDKGGGGIGDLKKTFATDHEIILVSHNNNELTGKRIGSVWDVKKDHAGDYVHATQKPIELPAKAIAHTTKTNDRVLDLFGGSGSTLMAADQLDRIAYLMEIDPKYCDVIMKRYEQYTGRKAVRINETEQTDQGNSG